MHRAEFEVEFGIPAAPPCSALIGPSSAHYSLYYFSWRARGKGKASETRCHAPPIRQKHLCLKESHTENVKFTGLFQKKKKEFKFQKVFFVLTEFYIVEDSLSTHTNSKLEWLSFSYRFFFLLNVLTAH